MFPYGSRMVPYGSRMVLLSHSSLGFNILGLVSIDPGTIHFPRMRRAGLAFRLAWNFQAGRAIMAGLVSAAAVRTLPNTRAGGQDDVS